LFHHWQGKRIVHVHLGRAGWFSRFAGNAPAPRPSVRMRLSTREVTTDLIGPPACEIVTASERLEILARLGPDPIRDDADPAIAWENLRRRRKPRPIGDALLDQRVLAGVGNIYRNEALYLAGIDPRRSTRRIRKAEWENLWSILRRLMRRGVARGRVVSADPAEAIHPLASRRPGEDFYVYRQARCRRCGSPLREIPLSGRRMFACP